MGLNKHVMLNDSISCVGHTFPLIILNFSVFSRNPEQSRRKGGGGEWLTSSVDPLCNCLLAEQRRLSEMMRSLLNSPLKMAFGPLPVGS